MCEATNDPDLVAGGTDKKLGGKIQKKVGDIRKVLDKWLCSSCKFGQLNREAETLDPQYNFRQSVESPWFCDVSVGVTIVRGKNVFVGIG